MHKQGVPGEWRGSGVPPRCPSHRSTGLAERAILHLFKTSGCHAAVLYVTVLHSLSNSLHGSPAHHTAGRGRKHCSPGASAPAAGTAHTAPPPRPPPLPPPPPPPLPKRAGSARCRCRVSCSGCEVTFSTLKGEWMVSTCARARCRHHRMGEGHHCIETAAACSAGKRTSLGAVCLIISYPTPFYCCCSQRPLSLRAVCLCLAH